MPPCRTSAHISSRVYTEPNSTRFVRCERRSLSPDSTASIWCGFIVRQIVRELQEIQEFTLSLQRIDNRSNQWSLSIKMPVSCQICVSRLGHVAQCEICATISGILHRMSEIISRGVAVRSISAYRPIGNYRPTTHTKLFATLKFHIICCNSTSS